LLDADRINLRYGLLLANMALRADIPTSIYLRVFN
jgi:hypothetical protein